MPRRKAFIHPTNYSRFSITVNSSGGILPIDEDDITIVFPAGFISEPSVTFNYSVTPHEFFASLFPDGCRPISAVLLLEPQVPVQFLKPIEITMPHFLDLETSDDCKRLTFVKACPRTGQEALKFEEMSHDVSLFTKCFTDSENVVRRVQYATLYINHCCYICSVENITSADTRKAKFCLTQALSKPISDSTEITLHYIIHYDLPTCLKVMD